MTSTPPIDSSNGSEPFDLAYEYQLSVVRHVRQGVKDLAAVRERIELQMQELQKQASALENHSEAITAIRDEAPGHDLSSRRAAIREQIADLKTQIDLVAGQEESLLTTSRRLQRHVEQFRMEKELLKASYAAADALISALEAMSVTSSDT